LPQSVGTFGVKQAASLSIAAIAGIWHDSPKTDSMLLDAWGIATAETLENIRLIYENSNLVEGKHMFSPFQE